MSRRGRKRARADQIRAEAKSEPPSRSELKNEAARAKLEPLRKGERPRAVTVAAVVALVLAGVNVTMAASGYKIQGHKNAVSGVVIFTALLLFMAWGLWRARYWAVLGMQALLAITIIIFGLALPFAGKVRAVLLAVGVLIPSTALFWFLIKAMARIQMPERH